MPFRHERYAWVVGQSQLAAAADTPLRAELDLRAVRHFTVVAEHLNFGRAAQALNIAQPALSRQMQRLERQLGATLLDRTTRGTRLSDAGAAFLPAAHELLAAAERAARVARHAGAQPTIVIGFLEDLIITPAVRALRRRNPHARIRTRHLDHTEARAALLDHDVDALVARLPLPFPSEHTEATVLFDEPRVLVVPTTHPLASRTSVVIADFADDALVPCPITTASISAAWSAFWRLEPRPGGRPASIAALPANGLEDRLELVAGGLAVAILPAGDRRFTLRDDLVGIPIDGAEPCQVAILNRTNDRDQLIADFRDCASTHLSPTKPTVRPPELVSKRTADASSQRPSSSL